jgi:hypothetical protein
VAGTVHQVSGRGRSTSTAGSTSSRINGDTFYMAEHQVARAYREWFARQDAADTLLKACLAETTGVVLSESGGSPAWLVIAARLARPVPRLMPAPTRMEAQDVLLQAAKTAARIKETFAGRRSSPIH